MSERFRETFKDVVLCRATAARKLFVTLKSGSTQSTERNGAHSNSTKGQLLLGSWSRNDRRKSL